VNSQRPTLPLGIDFGRSRIRVALVERDAAQRPRLMAVAACESGDDPAAALACALGELGSRERRCVIGITQPDASLHLAAFPPMASGERRRAAHFEAARCIDFPIDQAAVSLVPVEDGTRWVIGVARRSALADRVRAAKRARLRPLAVDDTAFALRRVHAKAEAVIDIGEDATQVIVFGDPIPFCARIPFGGSQCTAAIARSLGIDTASAETRKRTIGFGGAAESQRDTWIETIGAALAGARSHGYPAPQHIVMTGNGSRIPGLSAAIEHVSGCRANLAELDAAVSDALPRDVLRATGADWSIAYGLSLWSAAL
jgi:Tfp pilus assembly PilM family ATPase